MTATLHLALDASGCDSATVVAKPVRLSDTGSSCIAGNLAPAHVYFGRAEQILKRREDIKRKPMRTRRLRHLTEHA